MNLVNYLPKKWVHFELGKRAFAALILICITLILIGALALAAISVSIEKQEKPVVIVEEVLTQKKISTTPVLPSQQTNSNENDREESAPSIDNMTSKKEKVYHLSTVLSPQKLASRGVPNQEIQEKSKRCRKYINRFSSVAQTEMKKYGIPASIKLAQALLESDCGCSRLARQNNNHFGIKCFSRKCQKGHCSNFSDDSHKDFFRKYDNAWESFRSHSFFLKKKRYDELYKFKKTDYKSWANGLQKAGYATDKDYANKLIRVIEKMELWKFDE